MLSGWAGVRTGALSAVGLPPLVLRDGNFWKSRFMRPQRGALPGVPTQALTEWPLSGEAGRLLAPGDFLPLLPGNFPPTPQA